MKCEFCDTSMSATKHKEYINTYNIIGKLLGLPNIVNGNLSPFQ